MMEGHDRLQVSEKEWNMSFNRTECEVIQKLPTLLPAS